MNKNDLKSEAYLKQNVSFVEKLFGIKFRKMGKFYGTCCPFHDDSRPSFMAGVDKKGEVRFHCYGACKLSCDVYELIRRKKKCSITDAVLELALHIGVGRVEISIERAKRKGPTENAPDEPQIFVESGMNPDFQRTIDQSAGFYNRLLTANPDSYRKIIDYLMKRGVYPPQVAEFQIGYAPGLRDEHYAGRALIRNFLKDFYSDFTQFWNFDQAGLVRLMQGDPHFDRYVDHRLKCPFTKPYSDFFAGRITFPIRDIKGDVCGMMGRRPDKVHPKWKKNRGAKASSWLYGIDKAHRAIRHYRTAILVEGIFDYFAIYNLLQSQSRPIVLSTLGSELTDHAIFTLRDLGVEHLVVAYDWDAAGKKGIQEAAKKLGAQIHYLGGLGEGEDPADKLKGFAGAIDGFSLRHLLAASKRAQVNTEKPVHVSFITSGPRGKRNVVFSPQSAMGEVIPAAPKDPKADRKRYYRVNDFLPLLSYDHRNKAALMQKLAATLNMLHNSTTMESEAEPQFYLYSDFLNPEHIEQLGPALLMWLRILIEQQTRKKRVREDDSALAALLNTTRQTANRYKQALKGSGFLVAEPWKRGGQGLSAVFFPEGRHKD